MTRSLTGRPTRVSTLITDTAKEATITADAIAPDMVFGRRRPRAALMTNPIRGKRGISASTLSPSEGGECVRIQRLAMPVQRNDDSETDGSFRRGYGDDKERDDLAVIRTELPSKGDKAQIHGIEHDLDRQQDRDQIPPQEDTCCADGEQDGRDDQVMAERNHAWSPSRRARTTAPTIATRIRIDVASNANT